MNDRKRIGLKIRQAREELGFTQKEVAARFGCSQANMSDYERGMIGVDAADLARLAGILRKRLSYFYGEDRPEDRQASELKRLADQTERIREEVRRLAGDVVPYTGEWIWLPLIGQVPAGYPEWRDEDETDIFYPCAVEQIKDPEGAYALRVKGNSMVNCGISDGDIVFVDSKRQAQLGDVIVARQGDQVVLRIYGEDAQGPYLEAGNEAYPILRLKEAEILGVVMGSYRRKPRLPRTD